MIPTNALVKRKRTRKKNDSGGDRTQDDLFQKIRLNHLAILTIDRKGGSTVLDYYYERLFI